MLHPTLRPDRHQTAGRSELARPPPVIHLRFPHWVWFEPIRDGYDIASRRRTGSSRWRGGVGGKRCWTLQACTPRSTPSFHTVSVGRIFPAAKLASCFAENRPKTSDSFQE